MQTFWNFNGNISQIEEWKPGCWVQVTCPTAQEKLDLESQFGVPDSFVKDIADTEERSRYDLDEGWLMIILRIPHLRNASSRSPYNTIPLGILLKGDKIISVCDHDTQMMADFINHQKRRAEGFTDAADFVFRLFLSASVWYLKYLKQVSGKVDQAKRNLDRNVTNNDLIALSRLQDSLTYFGTSIRGNESLLSKLKFRLPVDALDAELIEDVNIEMQQARETTGIYLNILDSTMDTYSSIINNNMNTVMRLLTSLNMIVLFPTFITSMFGMNLINGMENWWFGFPVALILCFACTAISLFWFRKKRWL